MAVPQSSVLAGRAILVVEDDYFLAQEIAQELEGRGAAILGPVSNVADAIALLEAAVSLDGAVLDINLLGEMAYPIADVLRSKHTPFMFVTGYDAAHIPPAYRDVACCQKPVDPDRVARALFGQTATNPERQV